MPGFEYGYNRAVKEIIGGIITSILLNAFISAGTIDHSWILYFKILNTLATAGLILALPYWGTTYLIGWLFGLIINFLKILKCSCDSFYPM